MNELYQRIITALILTVILAYAIIWAPIWFFYALMLCAMIIICYFEWPLLWKKPWRVPTFFVYPGVSFFLLMLIQSEHRMLTLFTFVCAAAFDTGAYLAGKLYGTHKIAPSISPGKSWEGALGGYISTLLISLFFFKLGSVNLILYLLFIAGACIAALAGDLFESYLKRRAGLKDSASYLPGHGGLLDRFDSVLFLVIYVYAFKTFILTALKS